MEDDDIPLRIRKRGQRPLQTLRFPGRYVGLIRQWDLTIRRFRKDD
jgi:inorganic triphosphatase YgiF